MKNKLLIITLSSLILAGCNFGLQSDNTNSSSSSSNSKEENKTSSTKIEDSSSSQSSSSIENRISHNVTFIADGEEVETVSYYEGDTTVNEPQVPEKDGYTGRWEEYTLGTTDIVVNAVYEAITYTATFMVEEEFYTEVKYTIEDYLTKEIPEVPMRSHYIGRWSPEVDFSILDNVTYNAVYDLDLNVKNGNFTYADGKYTALKDNSLAISKTMTMSNGTLSTTLTKSTGIEDSGIVFGVTYSGEELNSYWEGEGVSYYYFFVNVNNCAYLAKSDNGVWRQLGRVEGIINYNEESDYPLAVSFENGYISCFVGDDCLIKYQDSNPLTGTGVGYRAQKEGTCYTDLVVSETVRKDTRDVIDGYTVAYGNAQLNGNTIKTTSGNTILVDENTRMADGKMYTTKFKPTVSQDAGIIIGLKDAGYRTFWEESWTQMEYYFFFINFGGILIVSKVGSTTDAGVWTTVADNNNIKDFDPNKTYELGVSVEGTTFKCYVDGMLVHTYNTNRELAGNMLGFRAAIAGAEYSAFETKDTPTSESLEWYQRSGSFVKDETGALTSYCNGSLAWVNNRSLTTGSFQVDITASEASDTGIIFGNSDPVATRWEERPYYFFFVNFGNDAILAGPVNGWTTFATGGNVADKLNPYGTPNTLKVEIKENYNIVCYVNGHEVINTTISDSSLQLTGTYFGVRCVGNGLRKFENFVIENA